MWYTEAGNGVKVSVGATLVPEVGGSVVLWVQVREKRLVL